MNNHIEENARLLREQSKTAIALAMASRWEEAVAVNRRLLELNPKELEASNRLGKAWFELGDWTAARKAFQRSLEISPRNPIARKNLERLERMKPPPPTAKPQSQRLAPHLFIEERGKSTQVTLEEPPDPSLLASVSAGMAIELRRHQDTLAAFDHYGQWLGQLPQALGRKLLSLMEGGNQYQAAAVSIRDDQITALLRESFQHPSQRGIVSFPTKENASDLAESAFSYDADEVEELEQAFPPAWEPEDTEEEHLLSVRPSAAANRDEDEEEEGPYPEETEE